MSRLVVGIAGLLFAFGLALSGMTDANIVLGFLNLAGDWDPSLAFVMVGAIGVHMLVFKPITRRPSPVFAKTFQIPSRKDIDFRLVGGATLFGLGWGLSGLCPGPALVSLTSLGADIAVFVGTMVLGMAVYSWIQRPKTPAC